MLTLPTATVSDVQRTAAMPCAIDPVIHCLVPGLKLAAPAFTVWAQSGSIITVHKALLEAPPGTVLVVGGETGQGPVCALFGHLMAAQAQQQGIVGIVIDGHVRDIADLRAMRFPVFARGTVPNVGLNRTVGLTQVPAPCGGILVAPGDWIVADDDGVVVIPADQLEQVVEATQARLQKEASYLTAMEGGQHVTDLIGFTSLIQQQGEHHG